MAGFVEQATLLVKDESSAQIKKINAALKQLAATAKSLKSMKVDFKVDTKGLEKAVAALKSLPKQASGINSAAKSVSQLADATKKLNTTSKAAMPATRAMSRLLATEDAARTSAVVTELNRKAEALKAMAKEGRDQAKAEKQSMQLALAANKVKQQETRLQIEQARALAQETKAKADAAREARRLAAAEASAANEAAKAQTAATRLANAAARADRKVREEKTKAANLATRQTSARATAAAKTQTPALLASEAKKNAARQVAAIQAQTRIATAQAAAQTAAQNAATAQQRAQNLHAAAVAQGQRIARAAAAAGGAGAGGPRGPALLRAGIGGAGRLAGGAVTGLAGMGLGTLALYQLGAAIGRSIKEGAKTTDTGVTSLEFKQLSRLYGEGAHAAAEWQVQKAQEQAEKVPGGAFLGIGKRRELFSEMLGVARVPGTWQPIDPTKPGGPKKFVGGRPGTPDYRPAAMLTGEVEEMTRMLVGLGQSTERAESQALAYAKALEQTGTITDQVTGMIDPAKAKAKFDFLRQMMPTIGREMTGDFTKNMIKYLRSEKYTVSDRALGAVLLLGEEAGTTAAVGYHQAVKQLSGQGQKKEKLGYLAEEGLLQKTIVPGAIGKRGKRGKAKVYYGEPVDKALLQEDMPAWVDKHLMPILEREGGKKYDELKKIPGQIKSDLSRDEFIKQYSNDSKNIASLAAKVAGDRTAVDSIIAMLSRSQEIQQQLDEAFARSGKVEDLRKATQFSTNIAVAQMGNQLQGAMGETIRSIAPWITEQTRASSQAMSAFSRQFKIDDTGKVTAMPPASEFAKAAATMLPVAAAGAWLAASQATTPEGRGFAYSVAALATAAVGLQQAGAYLMNVGKSQEQIDKEKKEQAAIEAAQPSMPESFEAQKYIDAAAKVTKLQKDLATVEAERKRVMEPPPPVRPGRTPPRPLAPEIIQERVAEKDRIIADTKAALAKAEAERATMLENYKKTQEWEKKHADEMKKASDATQAYRDSMKEATEPGKPLTKAEQRKQEREKRKAVPLPLARPPGAPLPVMVLDPIEVKPDDTPQPVTVDKPLEVTPTTPTPTTVTPAPVPVTPAPTAPTPTTALPPGFDITTFPQRFAEVFTTGAGQISTAGTTMGTNANSIITSGAAAAGAAYGAQAVAAIQGAVANINVNVNANVTGGKSGAVDTGTHGQGG